MDAAANRKERDAESAAERQAVFLTQQTKSIQELQAEMHTCLPSQENGKADFLRQIEMRQALFLVAIETKRAACAKQFERDKSAAAPQAKPTNALVAG